MKELKELEKIYEALLSDQKAKNGRQILSSYLDVALMLEVAESLEPQLAYRFISDLSDSCLVFKKADELKWQIKSRRSMLNSGECSLAGCSNQALKQVYCKKHIAELNQNGSITGISETE